MEAFVANYITVQICPSTSFFPSVITNCIRQRPPALPEAPPTAGSPGWPLTDLCHTLSASPLCPQPTSPLLVSVYQAPTWMENPCLTTSRTGQNRKETGTKKQSTHLTKPNSEISTQTYNHTKPKRLGARIRTQSKIAKTTCHHQKAQLSYYSKQ